MCVERAQEVVSAVGALRQTPDSPAEVRCALSIATSLSGAHPVAPPIAVA